MGKGLFCTPKLQKGYVAVYFQSLKVKLFESMSEINIQKSAMVISTVRHLKWKLVAKGMRPPCGISNKCVNRQVFKNEYHYL